ncbi:ArnT family glycosyltransferase [Hyphococcus lacteus]|uniref:Glycosyltransferase family 39 protein n=1 Tax=Hyphococcus lacteus TaxID=3143536 RepID=A0ABV3Z1C2_9PROT
MTQENTSIATTPLWRSFWAFAGALTLLRIITLTLSSAELGPDEAQYWYWSRDIDFGYYSKPPLIAWAIAATTDLFGNAPWAVRLSAPLLHFGAASFLYYTAKDLFSKQIAFWVGIGWLTVPGIILSSFLITTDALLLFFWSGAIYFLSQIFTGDQHKTANFAALGAMIGLGLLSKYAMIYFPVALGLMMIIPSLRQRFLRPQLALTAVVAFAFLLPNIIWNGLHEFQTLSHTADNANWGTSMFKPLSLLGFLTEQFAVFGIIPFAALIYIATKRSAWRDTASSNKALMLFILALTPLTVVTLQAFLSRAHANWAASAYPAAMLLVTWFLISRNKINLIMVNLAFNSVLIACFTIGVLNFSLIDQLGLSRTAKDIRGWQSQTDAIMARATGFDAIVIDDRYLIGEMLYHQRTTTMPIVALDANNKIDNHFEAFLAFDPIQTSRVLFVTTRDDAAHVDYRFGSITPMGTINTEIAPDMYRRYTLFALEDYFEPGSR